MSERRLRYFFKGGKLDLALVLINYVLSNSGRIFLDPNDELLGDFSGDDRTKSWS